MRNPLATKRERSQQRLDRRAKAAEIQAQERRAEQRRSLLIIGGAAAVAVLLVGYVVIAVMGAQEENDAVAEAAKADIDGVQEFSDLSQNHVETPVDYPQTPSVGGDHAPVWTNCGTYSAPVDPMQSTHSLEHGAVWIGHDPELPADQLETLEDLADRGSFVLLSPVEGMDTPVTASAWGVQLGVEDVDDPRLATFVQKYQQGEQTPELGAPCDGGVGDPD